MTMHICAHAHVYVGGSKARLESRPIYLRFDSSSQQEFTIFSCHTQSYCFWVNFNNTSYDLYGLFMSDTVLRTPNRLSNLYNHPMKQILLLSSLTKEEEKPRLRRSKKLVFHYATGKLEFVSGLHSTGIRV